MKEKEFYEFYSENELFISFIKELENRDFTPEGVGKALAFLFDNLDELRKNRKKVKNEN